MDARQFCSDLVRGLKKELANTNIRAWQRLDARFPLPCFFFAVIHRPLTDHARFSACNLQADRRFTRKFLYQLSQPIGMSDHPKL